MSKHSLLSPSSAYRWIACPGSINLSKKCPQPKESKYALEGTAAHNLAEKSLREGREPKEYKGSFLVVKGDDDLTHTFEVTDEMVEAVETYTNYITNLVDTSKHHYFEQKLDVDFIHEDISGTGDAILVDKKGLLTVCDLKYGKGIEVTPNWNPQLMIYALGAMQYIWKEDAEKTKKLKNLLTLFKRIKLVIVQPRIFPTSEQIKTWEIDAKDIYFWALHVLYPAARATEKENPVLRDGDHCRFCPALAICPQVSKSVIEIAQTDFNELALPNPSELSEEYLAKVLDASETINAWVNSVKAYAQCELESGKQITGYKLVTKRSNRKWIKSELVESTLTSYLGESAYDKKLIGIPAAEKLIKKTGQNPDNILKNLYAKPDAGVIIVKEEDKRPAVIQTPIEIDFTEEEDFLC